MKLIYIALALLTISVYGNTLKVTVHNKPNDLLIGGVNAIFGHEEGNLTFIEVEPEFELYGMRTFSFDKDLSSYIKEMHKHNKIEIYLFGALDLGSSGRYQLVEAQCAVDVSDLHREVSLVIDKNGSYCTQNKDFKKNN